MMDVPLGISENSSELQFGIYPQPAGDYLVVESKNVILQRITLIDPAGRVVLDETLPPDNHICIAGLDAGIYFLQAWTVEKIAGIKKIIKE